MLPCRHCSAALYSRCEAAAAAAAAVLHSSKWQVIQAQAPKPTARQQQPLVWRMRLVKKACSKLHPGGEEGWHAMKIAKDGAAEKQEAVAVAVAVAVAAGRDVSMQSSQRYGSTLTWTSSCRQAWHGMCMRRLMWCLMCCMAPKRMSPRSWPKGAHNLSHHRSLGLLEPACSAVRGPQCLGKQNLTAVDACVMSFRRCVPWARYSL